MGGACRMKQWLPPGPPAPHSRGGTVACDVPANMQTISTISTEGNFLLSSQIHHGCHSNMSPISSTGVRLSPCLLNAHCMLGSRLGKPGPMRSANRHPLPSLPTNQAVWEARGALSQVPLSSPFLPPKLHTQSCHL